MIEQMIWEREGKYYARIFLSIGNSANRRKFRQIKTPVFQFNSKAENVIFDLLLFNNQAKWDL